MSQGREPLPTHVRDQPPLPDRYHVMLAKGLGALGIDLAPDARAAIDDHVRLLLAWNQAINLTAIRDPVDIALRHVVDSLTALPWLRQRGVDAFLDLGSGGGYPGLPLAATLPGTEATLAEATAKKARFLEVAVEATGLASRVTVLAERAETIAHDPDRRGRWPVVTARAVASLPDLIELAVPLLGPGGSLLAWKRGELSAELDAAHRALDGLGGGSLDVLDVAVDGLDGHRLVVVTATGSAPAAFPRDPAARARRPW